MQSQPVMAWGILCIGIVGLMFVGMIVSLVVLLTGSNPRVRNGVLTALLIGPVIAGLLLVGLFKTRAVSVQQTATVVHNASHPPQAHDQSLSMEASPGVTTTILSSHGDLSRLPTPPSRVAAEPESEVFTPASTETTADALAALTTSAPEPIAKSSPNPAGDLRPDWLKKGVTKEGYVTTTVDCTGLYATEEEAERQVSNLIDEVMAPDFETVMRQNSSVLSMPVFRGPTPSSVQALYVKDRFVEVETRDLGTVTAPMVRIWLKMEQSPQTQAKLLELYRPHVAAFRLTLVATLLVGFLAIPVGILVSARGTRATHGRGKWLWKTAGTVLVLTVWVVGIVLLRLNTIIAL